MVVRRRLERPDLNLYQGGAGTYQTGGGDTDASAEITWSFEPEAATLETEAAAEAAADLGLLSGASTSEVIAHVPHMGAGYEGSPNALHNVDVATLGDDEEDIPLGDVGDGSDWSPEFPPGQGPWIPRVPPDGLGREGELPPGTAGDGPGTVGIYDPPGTLTGAAEEGDVVEGGELTEEEIEALIGSEIPTIGNGGVDLGGPGDDIGDQNYYVTVSPYLDGYTSSIAAEDLGGVHGPGGEDVETYAPGPLINVPADVAGQQGGVVLDPALLTLALGA